MIRKKIMRELALAAAMALSASTVWAQTYEWNSTTGGDFLNASNWNGLGGIPDGPDEIADFNTGSTNQTVTFSGSVTDAYELQLENANITFNMEGNSYSTINTSFYSIGVGYGANATLTVQSSPSGGTLAGTFVEIAPSTNYSGTVNVDSGVTLTGGDDLYVGWEGNGTLNVNSGGTASTGVFGVGYYSGSSGTVNVSGAGAQLQVSSILEVGGAFGGTGTMTVNDGATVSNGGYAVITAGNSASVDGSGTTWSNSSSLQVAGSLGVSNGGQVSSSTLEIDGSMNISTGGLVTSSDTNLYGSVSVSGTDASANPSTWADTGNLIMYSGSSLNISGGGVVTYAWYTLGQTNDAGQSTVTVTGAGSQFNGAGDDHIGYMGSAVLNIENGATAAVTGGNAYIGDNASGTLNVSGGSNWTVNSSNTLYMGNCTGGTGTINLDGAGSAINVGTALVGTTVSTFGPGSGSGIINITGGASFTDTNIYLGYVTGSNGGTTYPTGSVTISGAASSWTTTGNLYVGGGGDGNTTQGSGAVTINNGTVTVGGTLKIFSPNSNATEAVNLYGGTLNVGTLSVGSASSFNWTGGTLNITGSTLTIGSGDPLGSSLTLGPGMTLETSDSGKISLGSNSTLTINGGTFASTATFGTLSTSATIDIDSGSSFARTASTSIDTKFINDGTVNGPASGQLTLTGTSISGAGSYIGNITFNGTFSPGDSGPAAINLTGAAVTFGSSDNLEMDLDGITAGTGYDQLNFGSSVTATLGGKLTILLDAGFTPVNGDSFNLFTGGTSGSFSTVTLPTLALGLAWNTSELYSNGILSVGTANQWVSPGASGNFSVGTNWTAGTAPATGAQALFNTSSTSGYTVTFTAATTNDNAVIGNDTLTFDLHGNTYTLADTGTATPSLLVGVSGTGNLTLQSTGAAGKLASQYAMLGQASGDSGTVNINDPNVTWTIADNLNLGGSNTLSGGTGILNLANGNVTAGTLRVWNTNSAINLSGGTLSVGTLTLSNISELNWTGGTLNFTGSSGLTISSSGPLGASPIVGSGMTLEVSNTSATFTINTGSSNTFTINGGSASVTGASGAVEIGTSNVSLKDGGTFSSNSLVYVGYGSGTAGNLSVDGSNSKFSVNSNDLLLGAASGSSVSTNTTGTLNITNGGVVSDAVGELGELGATKSGGAYTSGTVSVSGAGSTWTNSGVIEIGGGGVGTLNISDGGSVTNTNAYLGDATTKTGGYTYYSSGTATIGSTTSTPSTWTTTGSMYVGGNGTSDAGSGTLTINSGGVVNVNGTLTIYKPANSSTTAAVNLAAGGKLNAGTLIDNGVLTNAGSIVAANMNISAGTYTSTGTTEIDGGAFTGGEQTVGGDFINDGSVDGPTTGGYLAFSGAVTGDGSFSNVEFAGSYTPDDPVISDLDNAVFDSSDTLTMDIEAATTPGAGYDQLLFAGSDTLGGTLDIQSIDSFIPAAGESFHLLDFDGASVTGTFDDLDLPALGPGLMWNTSRLYTAGVLSVTSTVPLPAASMGGGALVLLMIWRRCRRSME